MRTKQLAFFSDSAVRGAVLTTKNEAAKLQANFTQPSHGSNLKRNATLRPTSFICAALQPTEENVSWSQKHMSTPAVDVAADQVQPAMNKISN